ncbi:MAG: type ISP restriction/modification enzyme [Pirellulaceae bacterium]
MTFPHAMTSGSRKTPQLPVQPWLRAMARVILQLGQAIGELRDPTCLPGESLSAELPRDAGDRAALQAALLWTSALLMTHGRLHAWPAADGDTSSPAAPTQPARRLNAVRGAIDRACSSSPRIRELVGELLALQAATNMQVAGEEVCAQANPAYPLVYLMESLWAQVDAELRRRRGGYFTPQPLVQFIVRAVDQILRHDLDVVGGLAAPETPLRVVDPACGSGAFLLGVIEYIRADYRHRGDEPGWRRMAQHVLPQRLVGVDVMPACCGAAEMLVESQLGTCWSAHCGNILEDVAYARSLFADRVPVIVGNPPYTNFGRGNRGVWIREQLDSYKVGLREKKHNLDDDFIKFLRWGQYWIDQAGWGVLAMVTNNTYLEGLTHRQMRASLAASFDRIDVLDLHGNRKKRERTPTGVRDENVFAIQQGVAISVFIKRRPGRGPSAGRIRHAELWGSKQEKLDILATADIAQLPWQELPRRGPTHFFVPEHGHAEDSYRHAPRLDEIFQQHISGVQTKCDALFVGFTHDEVELRMRAFLADAARGRFPEDVPAWLPSRTAGVAFAAQQIRPYMVAPWDVRWIYYEPRLLGRARYGLLRHLDAGNVALVFMRQSTPSASYDHFLATPTLVSDRVFYNAHGAPFVTPLFTGPTGARVTNLQRAFLRNLEARLGTPWDETGDAMRSFGSTDVLHWMYALMHSSRYRTCHLALLCREFPRVPWPVDVASFRDLARLGKDLVEIHCRAADHPRHQASDAPAPCLPHAAVASGYPRWMAPATLFLDRALAWPEPIEEAVWQFRIGGYAVLPRWLKQRKWRVLTHADQQHLHGMIQAIRATLQRTQAIDQITARQITART